jgi:uncharacterized protein (DUF433 family)
MTLNLQPESPPLRADETGTVRVGDSQVILDLVIHAFRDGATPEQIVQSYDTLTLADVYAVVGYYLRHRDEVDGYLEQRQLQADELRKRIEASQGELPDIRARLLASRSQRQPA